LPSVCPFHALFCDPGRVAAGEDQPCVAPPPPSGGVASLVRRDRVAASTSPGLASMKARTTSVKHRAVSTACGMVTFYASFGAHEFHEGNLCSSYIRFKRPGSIDLRLVL
jgi:hypothetical protein